MQNKYDFMTEKTWVAAWKIIRALSPYTRIEMANTGEPTMHPDLLRFISIAREISPNSQIQVTTNGTNLIDGKITYKDLFAAGLNIVYTDMYAPRAKHEKLAADSGIRYFKYYEAKPDDPNAWTYHNDPSIQFIALSDIPDKWPDKKIKRGALGTFLNNIVFDKKAATLGIEPVTKPLQRRCNQPMKYIQVSAPGDYMMCCQDALLEAGNLGNVNEGVEGFTKFWFGEFMQTTRKILRAKNRGGHPQCKKCNIVFSRCDMKLWDEGQLDSSWDGSSWTQLGDREEFHEVPESQGSLWE